MSLYLGNTPIAGTGYDKANTDLSNLTSQGKNIANWSSNVTNCITEIPQDIKLELNNGTLTLKAGSKVYIPNGSGGFEAVITTYDKSQKPNYNANCLCFPVTSGGLANHARILCFSGTTQPTSGQVWLNTNTMQFYTSSDNGVTWDLRNDYCLPIAETIATSGTGITSIDQVFNGFGYIGSTVFALPNVKGLIPNGRNEDGSLKNIEFTTSRVLTFTRSGSATENTNIAINGNALSYHTFVYNDVSNTTTAPGFMNAGDIIYTSGRITSLTPKTAFHALDYNDSSTISGWSMPSSRYIDLTLGASGATYIAPANGYFQLAVLAGSSIQFYNQTRGNFWKASVSNGSEAFAETMECQKGDTVQCYYVYTTFRWFRFYYAEGEN